MSNDENAGYLLGINSVTMSQPYNENLQKLTVSVKAYQTRTVVSSA